MEFKILGTGSASPLLNRNPSAFIVDIDNTSILIDCGEGTQYRLLEYKIKQSRISYVLISHLHGDHYFGLIGLISSMNLSGRSHKLTIIGPAGLAEILTLQFKHSNTFINFELEFIDTNSKEFSYIIDNNLFSISSFPLQHRIPCTGFLVKKKTSKRKINKELLPDNLPIHYYKILQEGNDVSNESGEVLYSNSKYTLHGDPSKMLAYCSDTIFDVSLIDYFKNANLLYHEATFDDSMQERAAKTFHSTASQAAKIAKLAQVEKLIIGHFSSRFKTLDILLNEANSVFENTFLSQEGDIHKV